MVIPVVDEDLFALPYRLRGLEPRPRPPLVEDEDRVGVVAVVYEVRPVIRVPPCKPVPIFVFAYLQGVPPPRRRGGVRCQDNVPELSDYAAPRDVLAREEASPVRARPDLDEPSNAETQLEPGRNETVGDILPRLKTVGFQPLRAYSSCFLDLACPPRCRDE
jgi:hypothetical protein